MSDARKLAIAAIIGSLLALIPYGWARFRAATIIVPVSGRVTIDGQPLANAYIKFSPLLRPGESPLGGNPGSWGYTDENGNFALIQIANDQPGAVIGEHKIILRSGRPGPGPDGYVDERVPFSWRKGIRSHYVSWAGADHTVLRIETIDRFSPGANHGAEAMPSGSSSSAGQ